MRKDADIHVATRALFLAPRTPPTHSVPQPQPSAQDQATDLRLRTLVLGLGLEALVAIAQAHVDRDATARVAHPGLPFPPASTRLLGVLVDVWVVRPSKGDRDPARADEEGRARTDPAV